LDDMFSRCDIIPACDRQMDDRHLSTAQSALCIASRGKNLGYSPICSQKSQVLHQKMTKSFFVFYSMILQ